MIETTQEYKNQINETIRAPVYARAELHLIEPGVVYNATYTSSTKESYSTDLSKDYQVDYITLEQDWFKMDGSQVILPSDLSNVKPNGFVSLLSTDLVVSLHTELSTTSLRGISFHILNATPTTRVIFQIDAAIVEIPLVDGWAILDTYIPWFINNTVNVMITGSENKRSRLVEIVLGTVLFIDKSNLIQLRQDINYNYLSTELFDNVLKLNIYDEEKKYHPDNANGEWNKIKYWEKMKVYYSIGGAEFKRNILYLDDKKRIDDNTLQLTACSRLNFLNNLYDNSVFGVMDLAVLAQSMIKNNLILDLDFTKVTTNPMPILPVNQCLQLIANALCARLYINSNDEVVITNKSPVLIDKTIDFSEMYEKPTLDIKTNIKQVRVYVYKYDFYADVPADTVYNSGEITVTGSRVITTEWPDFSLATLNLLTSDDITIDDLYTKIHGYKAEVKLVGNGTCKLSVLAKKVPLSKSYITLSVSRDGEVCEIDNPLINTEEWAQEIAQWVADYYTKNKVYEASIRQDYALETGDMITFTDSLEQEHTGLVERLQLNVPGIKGGLQVRRWD